MVSVRCCYPDMGNMTCWRDFCFIRETLSRPDVCCCINSHNVINIILCPREIHDILAGYTGDNFIKEI